MSDAQQPKIEPIEIDYAVWCNSFSDARKPTMYAKMCWWHDKAIKLSHLASGETSAQPKIEPQQVCKHCGLRVYLDETSVLPSVLSIRSRWRHHGSNFRECPTTFAEPATGSDQQCPTCGTDIRCIHGKDFRETCEPCEAPLPASEAPSAATPDEAFAKYKFDSNYDENDVAVRRSWFTFGWREARASSTPAATPESESKAISDLRAANLFNFYTGLHRGFIFSARLRIVKAMNKAMCEAEEVERSGKERAVTPASAAPSETPIPQDFRTPIANELGYMLRLHIEDTGKFPDAQDFTDMCFAAKDCVPKVLTAADIERIGGRGHVCRANNTPLKNTCGCFCGRHYDKNWDVLISERRHSGITCKCKPELVGPSQPEGLATKDGKK